MSTDFYKTLGVDKKADEAEIKKAYRKLARKFHPDVNPNDPQAEKRFKEINEAYQTLSDSKKREQYDQFGASGFQPGQGRPGGGFEGYDMGGFDAGGGAGGFGDIFDMFFRGDPQRGGRAAPFRRPERGEDLHFTMALSFDEAFSGVEKDISYSGYNACAQCGGSGVATGSKPENCRKCGGTGQMKVNRGVFSMAQACPSCGGAGRSPGKPCPSCGGHGNVPTTKHISIKIPAGVDTGSKIRIPGKGQPGEAGMPPGDLYIITQIETHHLFERKGNNLYIEIPITIVEAALGTRIEIPTPEGKSSLKIPEGADSGKTFRLRGKGFPSLHSAGRGDLYVKIRVTTPKNLSKNDRDLLKQFAELHPEDPRTAF